MWPPWATTHQYKYMKYQLVTKNQSKQTIQAYLEDLSNDKLLELYDKTKDWLLKHEAESGTNNARDISGELYDLEQYEKRLHLLEKVEDVGRTRQLAIFLTDEEINKIFENDQS